MHKAVQLTCDLVSIPSVNPMGKNLTGEMYNERNMARYIQQYLENLGIPVEWQGADPLHPNIIAYINAGQPETILLEAHMDTVSHENMHIAPFAPFMENGLLYGRGSCDTKASLATYLWAVGEVVEKKIPLKRNIVLAFVHDEEYAFSGAKEAAARGLKADFAIVGEPTSLNIIHAHKGVCRFYIKTKGISCHASMPWLGENAIYKIAPVLLGIQQYAQYLEQFPHPVLGSATVNVGRIFGGQTVNTVPAECTIEVEHRLLPGMNFEIFQNDLLPFLEGTGCQIEAPHMEAWGVFSEAGAPSCMELKKACEQEGVFPELQTAHYATDASVFQRAGIPCVVFGPGSISKAHTADEFVPVADIEKAAAIVLNLLKA